MMDLMRDSIVKDLMRDAIVKNDFMRDAIVKDLMRDAIVKDLMLDAIVKDLKPRSGSVHLLLESNRLQVQAGGPALEGWYACQDASKLLDEVIALLLSLLYLDNFVDIEP